MQREQLEHIVRACGDLLDEQVVIIVGSQAILGTNAEGLPHEVTFSIEADVMAVNDPTGEKAMRINGAIGELSLFQETYGFYAEGVEEGLCRLPPGWRNRLIPLSNEATNGVTALCLEIHDLCVSKLLAGRPKDVDYVAALLKSGHARPDVLLVRAAETATTSEELERFVGLVTRVGRPGRKSKARHDFRDALRKVEEGMTD